MIVARISEADIEKWRDDARRSGLIFCIRTELYGAFEDDMLVGFMGILFGAGRSTHAIFKSIYIPPENRGRGYFKAMLRYCIVTAVTRGVTKAEANCTPMSVRGFLEVGFLETKRYKNGITKVRHENLAEAKLHGGRP
jgi:GNAT superfamily N-acetyltransferase